MTALSTSLTKITTHVNCPRCHKPAGTIDHLQNRADRKHTYRWSCESCGCNYRFTLSDGKVTACEDLQLTDVPGYALLASLNAPLDKAIIIAIPCKAYRTPVGKVNPFDREELEGKRYYYECHTCPTNFLGGAALINYLDESDPHGVFYFLDAISIAELAALGEDDDIESWAERTIAKHRELASVAMNRDTIISGTEDNVLTAWCKEHGKNTALTMHMHRHLLAAVNRLPTIADVPFEDFDLHFHEYTAATPGKRQFLDREKVSG